MASTPQDRAIARLKPARARSRAEWALLRARLATITPQAVGRGTLSLVVTVVAAWLAAATWPSLLPFAIGGLLAYTIYPLVGVLDRVMPRVLAAAIALLAGLAALVLIVAVVIPPLVSVAIQVLRELPSSTQLADLRAQLDAYLATLPEGARTLVLGVLERVASIVSTGLSSFLDSIASLIVAGVVGIFDTIGFVVGLVLLPLWVLSVVRDGRSLRGQIAAQFAPGLRADAMALLTIVHRALSTFLRVQIAAAAALGVVVYAGLDLVAQAGIASYSVPIAIAAFMGTAQVIPQLGGLIGAIPIVLVAFARQDQPEAAVALLVVYLVAQQLVKVAVGGRLGRDLNVRPALALPAFAVISQIGLGWLLLSAPILVIARNMVIYLRGRLAEPPLPAGVLPWERGRRRTAAVPAAAASPIYRGAGWSSRPAAPRVPDWIRRGPAPAAQPVPGARQAVPPPGGAATAVVPRPTAPRPAAPAAAIARPGPMR
jgi:predicted PurR-regulated permease PerM